jgi:hypothetical protein
MPQVKLDARQLVDAIEERLSEACPSVVLANFAAAFERYTNRYSERADMFPELTGVVAGHLREMADTARKVESGDASVKPKRARLPRKAFRANAKALPPCAAMMGCLCAAHARGAPASSVCDATE